MLMPASSPRFSSRSLIVPSGGLWTPQNAPPVSSRALDPRYRCFNPKDKLAQHGVKALDGGDADATETVELGGLIDSLPRIDPSGFPSVSHRFPLAPLQVVDDLL